MTKKITIKIKAYILYSKYLNSTTKLATFKLFTFVNLNYVLFASVHNTFTRFSSNYCLLKVNLYHIHTYIYLALHFGVIF